MATQYPLQCFKVVRNQTFAVDNHLTAIDEEHPPLQIYHNSFARFTFTVLKGGDNKVSVSANLNVKDIPYLAEQTKICLQQEIQSKLRPATAEKSTGNSVENDPEKPPCYTLTFRTGECKGKTPASVAMMDNGIELLRQQYRDLKSNLEKYPDNQKLMDAITEAVNLQKQGKLTAEKRSADIAYATTFKSGNLKGKSPAQVLLEDTSGGVTTLQGQRNFLERNVSKYPNNQLIIEAIDAAMELKKAGTLSREKAAYTASSTSVAGYVLHDADFLCHVPFDERKGNPGYDPKRMSDVSHLRITWEFGQNYPVCIYIEKYQAHVEVNPDGTQSVDSNHVNTVQMKMKLSAKEWQNCLYNMQMNMNTFEMLQARNAYETANRLAREAALAAKAAKELKGDL